MKKQKFLLYKSSIFEPEFNFTLNDEKNCKSEFSVPKKYIFIPNNSVLKSGAFNLVSEKFN